MVREHNSVLAASEKRLLMWMAERLPAWVNSDHLTSLGAVAMLGVGACFWAGGGALLAGDPAARRQLVRRQPRRHAGARAEAGAPALRLLRRSRARRGRVRCLFGGLMLGGHMSLVDRARVPRRLLPAGGRRSRWRRTRAARSRWPFMKVGPTELRILLAVGHAAVDAVGLRRRCSASSGCCSTSAARSRSAGLARSRFADARAVRGTAIALYQRRRRLWIRSCGDTRGRRRLPLPFQDPHDRETRQRRTSVRADAATRSSRRRGR